MTTHKISWLNMPGYQPETWNPIIGCSKVSSGCDNCYALKMAKRIAGMERTTGRINYRATLMPDENNIQNEWNGHTFLVKEALSKPASWKSPRMIFVNSMGDLFHEGHLFEWIDAVFSVMSDNDQHLYILLTKRPENMLKFWQWKRAQHCINWQPKANVWIGVTAENQEQANKRIPILLQIPASKRFVSIEPMLGPVELGVIHYADGHIDALNGSYNSYPDGKWTQKSIAKLDWVICGGESGPKARPMHPDWVRSVRNQCQSAGTPFFFKQWANGCQVN
jgi:protein gp37